MRDTLTLLTRVGFAARGLLYLIIGWLALRQGREEDPTSALAFVERGAGQLAVAAIALGFLGYGIWRIANAAYDLDGHGSDARGYAVRAGGAVSGVLHLGLSFLAARLALGGRGGDGDKATESAATALSLPGGQLILWLVAGALLTVGLFQMVNAIKGGFLKRLDQAAASQEWIRWVGRAGYAARSLVFLMTAWFVASAARQDDPSEAGGMSDALASMPGGVEVAAAAGLFLFGLFSLIEARYRRIPTPRLPHVG